MQYLDLHTHQVTQVPDTLRIQSLHLQESTFLAMPKSKPISIGLHPWYTKYADFPILMKYLRVLVQQQNVKLIGECGLDALRGEPLDKQQEMLLAQFELAKEYQKPLILHCVRAFEQLIQLKKAHKPQVPLIIHGFNKKPELAQQLINQGFYLSFGFGLLRNPALQNWLSTYTGPFFLESDDSDQSIADLYAQVADLKKMQVDNLKDVIFAHAQGLGLQL